MSLCDVSEYNIIYPGKISSKNRASPNSGKFTLHAKMIFDLSILADICNLNVRTISLTMKFEWNFLDGLKLGNGAWV